MNRARFLKKIALAAGASAALLMVGCATSWEKGTKATLRPDLTKDDREIWEVYSGGNGYTSSDKVKDNAIIRGAVISLEEKADCFLVYASESDVKDYSYTTISTYGKHEMPAAQTHNYSKYSNTMYVELLKKDKCDKLKQTKWRNNVYYNSPVIENAKNAKTKSNIWIIAGGVMLLVIIIAGSQ